MSGALRNIIQPNNVRFVKDLDCSEDFLSHFVSQKIIPSSVVEDIGAARPSSKNGTFLRLIEKKGLYALDVFYDALVATFQFDLADILKPDLAPSRRNASIGIEETGQRGGAPVGAAGDPGPRGGPPDAGGGSGLPASRPLIPGVEASREPVYEEVDWPPRTPPAPTAQPDDWETDSVLSDGLEYLDERNELLDDIRLRVAPCRKQKIRKLFYSKTVYKMSPGVRGRCLIINNRLFDKPALLAPGQVKLSDRDGSQTDVRNISLVLKQLKFEYDKVHTDVSSQDMLKVIEEECKHPAHREYGMFVLVIMTHGSVNTLYGKDGRPVEVTDIYDRMSAYRFPSMADKPKLIILQACSGGRIDSMGMRTDSAGSTVLDAQPPPEQIEPPFTDITQGATLTKNPLPGDHLATDDMYILKPSFLSYVSSRHERQGTWFIRAIVEALYKHACHRDLQAIFVHIQNKVRAKSLQANRRGGYTSGQHPTGECFFTKSRKLFLFPDYNPDPPPV